MATPTSNAVPTTYDLAISFNDAIDALVSGVKWGGALGSGITLTYSFPDGQSSYQPNYGNEPYASEWDAGWYALLSPQQTAVERMLLEASNVADIVFTEVDDNDSTVGEIRVALSEEIDNEGAGGWAYSPGGSPAAGDIWLSPSTFSSSSIDQGSWEFSAVLHELGHALGLSHPFGGDSSSGVSLPGGPDGTDNFFYTVMSYTEDPSGNGYYPDRFPSTLMPLDIQALQYIYGENTAYNADDTTYFFDEDGLYLQTIWDGGGTDTIDYSSSSTAATLDLRDGAYSTIGLPVQYSWDGPEYVDARTVWIAYGADIENAMGGRADDLIYGNQLRNVLTGNAGDDRLYGNGSGDRLKGQGGRDKLYGGAGPDKLYGGSGADLLSGGKGKDKLYGGSHNDILKAGGGADKLFGGNGDDVLKGGKGKDVLNGNAGDDILTGGSSADTFRFNGNWGDDTITDFNPDTESIALVNTGLNYDDLLLSSMAEGAMIDDGAGNTIHFLNVDSSELDVSVFLFS